jgi:hypothetical protein
LRARRGLAPTLDPARRGSIPAAIVRERPRISMKDDRATMSKEPRM